MRRALVVACSLLLSCAAAPAERFGICDASAAAYVAPDSLWVADDEDNVLRRFDGDDGVASVQIDLNEFLKPEKRGREVDLEAVARIGETFYWIGSHGRSGSDKPRPTRHRLFATRLNGRGELAPYGVPFRDLLDSLRADPRYQSLGLDGVVETESLSQGADGALLIGFRQPLPEGRALLVPLMNPDTLLTEGVAPSFGDPMLLDLGGRSLRSMARLGDGRWLLSAGEVEGQANWIALWDGSVERTVQPLAELEINAEAIAVDPEGHRIWLLSDDGRRSIEGRACKELEDPSRRRFRYRSFPWPER